MSLSARAIEKRRYSSAFARDSGARKSDHSLGSEIIPEANESPSLGTARPQQWSNPVYGNPGIQLTRVCSITVDLVAGLKSNSNSSSEGKFC